MREKIELMATKDGNAILGNFYRVSGWEGNRYLGEQLFSGHTKREALQLAKKIIRERGEFFS